MEIADLFAGIGGVSYGFHLAGFTTAWASETDRFARRIYTERFPAVPLLGDIRDIKDPEPADVYCAGFPCQDLSLAGQRKGLKGERSGLFFQFVRLVERARPRWLFLENVPGLLSSDDGRDFARVLRYLGDLGYGVAWRVLDAQFFGVPQRRRRVWIVGSLGDLRCGEVFLEPASVQRDSPSGGATGQDVTGTLGGGSDSRGWCDDLDRSGAFIPARCLTSRNTRFDGDTETRVPAYALRKDPGGTGQGWNCNYITGRRHPDRNLREDGGPEPEREPERRAGGDGGSSSHANGVRTTPGLSRRLDEPRYRALGNAVPVPVVAWIAERIAAVENRCIPSAQAGG